MEDGGDDNRYAPLSPGGEEREGGPGRRTPKEPVEHDEGTTSSQQPQQQQQQVKQDEGSDEEEGSKGANVMMMAVKGLRKNKQPERQRSFVPPRVNCAEKIILCVDMSAEMSQLPFQTPDGTALKPLSMIRRVVDFFVHSKHRIDDRHEFALVLLQDDAIWLKDFVNDPKDFLKSVNDIQDTCVCDTLNFASLLDLICEKIALPVVEDARLPPPYTVRVIMLYTRSFCVPDIEGLTESHKQLRSSEYFFFDVFYIHLPPSDENCCQDIFDFFCNLDERGTYYILEEVRNITSLHSHMMKFLAHPLQRLPQSENTNYSPFPTTTTTTTTTNRSPNK